MKDLGLMHYFLVMEIWQILEGIFINQGKHAMKILKRFDMLDYKSMDTPMDTNLKLLSDESLELIYVTHFRQIIGLLMCLMNIGPNI